MSAQTQGRHKHDFKFIAPEEDYTAEPDISTANVPISTAGAEVSTISPEVKTVAESLVYIRRSAAKRKDKGKAIMKEAEPVQKKTKLQLEYMHDPLKWKLYDICVVHHVSTERGHDFFMLVEKYYPLIRALMTLMMSNKLQVDEYSMMADELLRKIFLLANRPIQ
ncbi:hypothetical protein Tco_0236015 [Tanacetum coccineum]